MTFNVQFNKFGEPNYPYIYEILHKPTGSVYVGVSEANKRYQNGYWGSASGKSNQLMHRQTILKNIQDYQKTILMYFKTYNEALKYEEKKIKEYFKEYGNLCLNKNVGGKLTKEACREGGKKGGVKGGAKSKGKVYIHKDEIEIRCCKEELAQMLSEGWIKGRTETICQEQSNRLKSLGDNHPSKRPEVKEKIKKTNIELWDDDKRKKHANTTKEVLQRPGVKEKHTNNRKNLCKGEENGTKTMFKHPYNPDFIGNGNKISNDIKKNWSHKPQWNQISYREKENFRIK